MKDILNEIESLFREKREEDIHKILEDKSFYYQMTTKQKFRLASILRINNRIDDAIEVLSNISEENMSGVLHLRGNYRLSAEYYDSARSDFEEVIIIEQHSGDLYCTEEAIFLLAYCHIMMNSSDKHYYIEKIDENSKVFIKDGLWSKGDLLKMSNKNTNFI